MQRCCRWIRRVGRAQGGPSRCHRHLPLVNQRFYTDHTSSSNVDTGRRQPDQHHENGQHSSPWDFAPTHAFRKDPDSWIAALTPVIPPNLSAGLSAELNPDVTKPQLSPHDVASIIAIARTYHKVDVLSRLAERGQWRAVVWLVTYLIDGLWKGNPIRSVQDLSGPWQKLGDLSAITSDHVELRQSGDLSPKTITFENAVDSGHPLSINTEERVGHDILGQIWESLGKMILADAKRGTIITPAILEIIALLHHRGIMPESIYSYAPPENDTALRQPPTLHLLSSRILTSLSDAAWKAHETTVVKEAQAKKGSHHTLGPEIPSSMYRVNVGGLGHEIWLELVLWSCLQGGWTAYGAAILSSMISSTERHTWSALSWRETISPMIRAGEEKTIDWNKLRYLFDTTPTTDSASASAENRKKVTHTVSSEVVTAYVDALVNTVRVGVGERGTALGVVLTHIRTLGSFLERNMLGLESMSWDAVVLRIFESQGIMIRTEPGLAERVLELSSSYGRELAVLNAPTRDEQWQPLTPYLIDGTAATLGISHRVIQAHIQSGNLFGALRAFQALQARTDRNKMRSLSQFFEQVKRRGADEATSRINFEGRYSRVEYPGFFPQLPATVLAPFFDLITESRAFSFGRWLLVSKDPDGPTVSKAMYTDPAMLPSLLRFASASGDKALMLRILAVVESAPETRKGPMSKSFLLALLEARLNGNSWEDARRTVTMLFQTNPEDPDIVAEATAMIALRLLRLKGSRGVRNDGEFEKAIEIFTLAVQNNATFQNKVQRRNIDCVLVTLAFIDEEWAELCRRIRTLSGKLSWRISAKSFNLLLQGIVDAYGSDAGKRFLIKVWQPGNNLPSNEENGPVLLQPEGRENHEGTPRMPAKRPGAQATPQANFYLDLGTDKDNTDAPPLRVSGLFRPTFSTIRIVLRKLLAERETWPDVPRPDKTVATNNTAVKRIQHPSFQWPVEALRLLGMHDKDIIKELDGDVTEEGKETD